jgi:hypothetical protein
LATQARDSTILDKMPTLNIEKPSPDLETQLIPALANQKPPDIDHSRIAELTRSLEDRISTNSSPAARTFSADSDNDRSDMVCHLPYYFGPLALSLCGPDCMD